MSLLAVLAISAVASASASAAHPWVVCTKVAAGTGKYENSECKKEGGGKEWELKEVAGTEKIEVTGTSGTSKLVGVGLITIECTADTFTGSLELRGLSTGEVKFTGCSVVGAPKCKVTEPIAFKFEDKTTVFEEAVGDLFEPESGLTFVTIKITGAECAGGIVGEYKVIGKQQCKLPEGEVAKVEHEIVCEPKGSELKLRTAVAEFTSTEKVKLTSGFGWRVKA